MNQEMQQFKANFFKALAHPLRIQILEILSDQKLSVNQLQAIIGIDGSAISQQLKVLRMYNMVLGIKEGNRVIYSLRDPMIADLLDIARKIFNNQLITTISILDQLKEKPQHEE
ncbi:metalloregulator ArsR/SmtB family transcription factor [Fodinisporobacter ferrooxydans]|uniref:Metalloregulator ArsR/SmtB family transcription factor n=1 Tax=Fodinisporobacter ferrooxydans TaxID=2901836 RepID=A0ABY4CQA2_9BACL|nr:metalloregulator ArsR/SmtB family transcription factor [Alicyclobacillaceae bacterium MYW30-H2]